MIDIYLFDWGDTLMVDHPDSCGKMCDWPEVEAVTDAFETLEHLSKQAQIYIATGAADSSERDIAQAFERVNLSQFITGYFCQANIGVGKGHPEFLPRIIEQLDQPTKPTTAIAMVGDNFDKDIAPALACGIQAIWLSTSSQSPASEVRVICSLKELIQKIN